MTHRHPFRDANPKHLDCGDLIDAETGRTLRPTTAWEASRPIPARRQERDSRGVRDAEHRVVSVLATARAPGADLADGRLAVAPRPNDERRVFASWEARR
jgi:hypothetical protein